MRGRRKLRLLLIPHRSDLIRVNEPVLGPEQAALQLGQRRQDLGGLRDAAMRQEDELQRWQPARLGSRVGPGSQGYSDYSSET